MNFQVLSMSFQAMKSEVFYFCKQRLCFRSKKKNGSKRKHRVPELFHKQEEKTPFNNLIRSKTRAKKNNTLVSGNAEGKKNFHPGGRKKYFVINLIDFFKRILHLKKPLLQYFSFLKNNESYLLLFEGKKRKFVRINLLVEIFLFLCVYFETKNTHSHTHSTHADG